MVSSMSETHHDILSPFVHGVLEMLSTMLYLEAEQVDGPPQPANISAMIALTGAHTGAVVLSLSLDEARELVAAMLGMDLDQVDEETLRDGIGEMTNIAAGYVRATLASKGIEFKLSVPTLHVGEGHYAALISGRSSRSQTLSTELGTLVLNAWLSEAP